MDDHSRAKRGTLFAVVLGGRRKIFLSASTSWYSGFSDLCRKPICGQFAWLYWLNNTWKNARLWQWSHTLSQVFYGIYKSPKRIYKYSRGFRTPAVDQSYWSVHYNYDLNALNIIVWVMGHRKKLHRNNYKIRSARYFLCFWWYGMFSGYILLPVGPLVRHVFWSATQQTSVLANISLQCKWCVFCCSALFCIGKFVFCVLNFRGWSQP